MLVSVVVLILLFYGSEVQGQDCVDGFKNVTFEERGQPVNYKNCTVLVAAWPYYCNPDVLNSVAADCCHSCKDIDYQCRDKPVSLKKGNQSMLCVDMISQGLSGYCKSSAVASACCQSCSQVDLDCVDNPVARWTKGRGCMEMIDSFGCHFCDNYGSYCCQSCKPLTPKYCENEPPPTGENCRDDPTWKLLLDGRQSLYCKDLSKPEYQCQCKQHRRSCCHSCKDIDDDVCRNCGGWKQTVRGIPYADCSLMVQFPYFCNNKAFYNKKSKTGLCCEACSKLESEMTCSDDPFQDFGVEKTTYYCDSLIEYNHCLCDNRQVSKICCHSCQNVNTDDCGCKDLISTDNSLTILGVKYNTCNELLHKTKGYPYYCTSPKFKDRGGVCCKSCQNKDTTCVDQPILVTPYVGAAKKPCRTLVKQWPYFCKNTSTESVDGYKDKCCQSCRNKDTSCTDSPVPISPYPGAKPLMCKQLTKEWPYYCKPGVHDNTCCHSCRKRDVSCTDNPTWKQTIKIRKKKWETFSCATLSKDKKLLRKACCKNMFNAKTECCVSCLKYC